MEGSAESPGGGAGDGRPSPAKRKHESDGPQQRAKRNRYISIACNECKRRKIKCNGETPCQRCGHLSLDCVYAPNCCSSSFKDSDEYRQISQHLQSLQDQVNTLYTSIAGAQDKASSAAAANIGENGGIHSLVDGVAQASIAVGPQYAFDSASAAVAAAAAPQRAMADPPHGPTRAYSGPTVAGYYLERPLVDRSMTLDPHSGAPAGSLSPMPHVKPVIGSTTTASTTDEALHPMSIGNDPLWTISLDEALRLCHIFADHFASIYPVIGVDKLIGKARTLFRFLDSMRRVGLMTKESQRGDSFCDIETLILKMILALATTRDERGCESMLGKSLFENVQKILSGEEIFGAPASIPRLQLWLLIASYNFKSGAEMQAYRSIGIAARQAFEIGLHRSEALASLSDSPGAVLEAVRLFWVIYIFDKLFSFSTGLPYAIHEDDIDQKLPQIDEHCTYARAMLRYCRIATRVWVPTAGFEPTRMLIKQDNMSFMDWEISQYSNEIPAALRFTHLDFSLSSAEMSAMQKRLRAALYIRINQLRLQLYRPVFYQRASTLENGGFAQTAVEIAKDNIRTLSELDKATDIYNQEQQTLHQYLVTAIGVLFLAVAQAPVNFAQDVRDEFYLALDLIKAASTYSAPLQRLNKTIQILRKVAIDGKAAHTSSAAVAVAAAMGEAQQQQQHMEPWTSQGVAADGIGGIGVAGTSEAQTSLAADQPALARLDTAYMAVQLSQLFEFACECAGNQMINGQQQPDDSSAGAATFAALWDGEGEFGFARAVKDVL